MNTVCFFPIVYVCVCIIFLRQFERDFISHYLDRRCRLHLPGVQRLFFASVVDSRAQRANVQTREYIGFTRDTQGHWDKDFMICHIPSPQYRLPTPTALSPSTAATDAFSDEVNAQLTTQSSALRQSVAAVNKLRPKFVVVVGHVSSSPPPSLIGGSTVVSQGSDGGCQGHTVDAATTVAEAAAVSVFRRCMTRLSDSIPVVYIPGSVITTTVMTASSVVGGESAATSTPAVPRQLRSAILQYRQQFGADYYGLW